MQSVRTLLYPFFISRLVISLFKFNTKLAIAVTPHHWWWLAVVVLLSAQTLYWGNSLGSFQLESGSKVSEPTSATGSFEPDYYRDLLQLQPTHRDLIINLSNHLEASGETSAAKRLQDQARIIDPLYFISE